MNTTYHNSRPNPVARVFRIALMVIGGAALASGLAVLFGYFVMLLWNWLMPGIFGLTSITFWQAVGIIILARLIFGGFKHHDHHEKHNPHKDPGHFAKTWINSGKIDRGCFSNDKNQFHKFWEKEGKEAFANYVERQKNQNEGASS